MFRCWMKGNAAIATTGHCSIHWAFPEKPEVISAIYMIFLMAALSPKAFRPLGKPAVPLGYAGSPLICGMAGPKRGANITPLPMNYLIAAMPPTFLKRFVFVTPNIAEVTRERSNGWPNKPAEWLPTLGVDWDYERD